MNALHGRTCTCIVILVHGLFPEENQRNGTVLTRPVSAAAISVAVSRDRTWAVRPGTTRRS